jgi:hypothetical protein
MSTSENNILLDPNDAVAVHEQVYQNVLFQKMAAAGYQPQNEKAAMAMLETAVRLREAEQLSTKQANFEENDPFVAAKLALDETLGGLGVPVPNRQKQAAEAELLQVAAAYAQDPAVYRSVLTLDHYNQQQS